MQTRPLPAIELSISLNDLPPGRALDLACGAGRHALWLRDKGWNVTAVDLELPEIEGVTLIKSDLERGEFSVEPKSWDLIVCWLYWQENLLPWIAAGVRDGGAIALAGKTSGRFATSLGNYRKAFPGWKEIASGEDDYKTYFVARNLRGA